jgi:hypothetical protein
VSERCFGLLAMMELLEAASDRRAPLPARAPPDEARSEQHELLVVSGQAGAPAPKVDFGRNVLAERLDFQVCDQVKGGGCLPHRNLAVAPYML